MIYPASADGERTEDPETGEPFEGNDLGWIDPRALDADGNLLSPREIAPYEGELAWPERFDRKFDVNMAFEIGDYGYASQYQQSPVPRKGGIGGLGLASETPIVLALRLPQTGLGKRSAPIFSITI
jgi:hypothetical protein